MDTAQTQVFTVITQGGAFGLLAIIVIYGIPKLVGALDKMGDKFTSTIENMAIRHADNIKQINDQDRSEREATRIASDAAKKCNMPPDGVDMILRRIDSTGECPMAHPKPGPGSGAFGRKPREQGGT